MQLHRPPDRLGRPPNCRWIMLRPPDPPPKRAFGNPSFPKFSNDLRAYDCSLSTGSAVMNATQMELPVGSCRRVVAMTLIYDSGDRNVSGKLHKSHFLPINYFWPKPLRTMQLDRPPDRLGRPPNCRWIMRRPPDPPPKKVSDSVSSSKASNDLSIHGRSQSSRSIVINRIQMKMPVPSCQRFGGMKHIYDSSGTCATSKNQQSHFLPIN